ncbi:hypothetical protein FKP32DRAFT_1596816 [Trametes sanguinea]|nr:hypothetical protein FKP32DRAFT_1596816 [Trametes sanguinea]
MCSRYLDLSDSWTTWLLVLKDNSSYEALHAPLEAEDVRALKEFLGVRPQGARWYDVSGARRLCGACTMDPFHLVFDIQALAEPASCFARSAMNVGCPW